MLPDCKVFSVGLLSKLNILVGQLNQSGDLSGITTARALLVRLIGDRNAAAMAHQLIYWFPKAKNPDNWVYKSWRDWGDELALSPAQVKRVLREGFLEATGFIRELKKANGAPTNHYLLDVEAFLNKLADFLDMTVERLIKMLDAATKKPAPTREGYDGKRPRRQSAAPQTTEHWKTDPALKGASWSDFSQTSHDTDTFTLPKGKSFMDFLNDEASDS